MRIHVRNLVAACPKCGGEEFDALARKDAAFPSDAEMRCAGCGAISTYIELIMQIAKKALAHSVAARQELQEKHAK